MEWVIFDHIGFLRIPQFDYRLIQKDLTLVGLPQSWTGNPNVHTAYIYVYVYNMYYIYIHMYVHMYDGP